MNIQAVLGKYLFYQQVTLYVCSLVAMLTIAWINGIQTLLVQRFGAWHMVITIQLIIFALFIRLRLPHTMMGCFLSVTCLIYVGIVGECYLSIYGYIWYLQTGNLYAITKTISAGWIGLICFWVIALASGAYKLFNGRTLWFGFLSLTIFMFYWYFGLGFVSTLVMVPSGTTLTANPLANLLENLYYTIIFVTFLAAFKRT